MNQSSSPTSRQTESSDQLSAFGPRSENHRRIAAIVGGALVAIFLYYLFSSVRLNSSQLAVPAGATAFSLVATAMSQVFNRRGHSLLASLLLVGGLLLVAPVTATAATGIGVALAVAASIVAIQTVVQTFENVPVRWAIAASILSAVSTILLDQQWTGTRVTISEAPLFVPAAALLMVLANTYFVARRYRDFSIRIKLIASTFAMPAVALTVTVFFVSRNTSTILTENVGRELRSLADSQALAVGELLGRQTALLELLSQNQTLESRAQTANAAYGAEPSLARAQIEQLEEQWATNNDSDGLVQEILNHEASAELRGFHDTFPSHLEAYATDIAGALLAATHWIPDYYQAEEAWWQAAFNDGQGALFIDSPAFDESFDTVVIRMATPMRDLASGEIVGILRTTYSLRDLTELLASVEIGEAGHIELLLPSNEFYDAQTGEFEELHPETLSLLESMRDEQFSEIELEEEPSLVGQAAVNTLGHVPPVDALGWRVVVHQLRAKSLAVVAQQQRALILVAAAALALTSVFAALIGRALVSSITRLTDVAAKVEAGDLSARAEVDTVDEVGQLAGAFNNMTFQLQEMLTNLERQVAIRTRALEASTEVSRSLSTILDHGRLVAEVVEQIRSAFGYYHAHIYLLDSSNERLVMAGGTGDAGRAMLGRRHSVEMGQGLVGRAFADKAVVLVPDVDKESGWLPNPLLPETRSEIAAPIIIGDQALGVLDVQQNVVNGLTSQDAQLLQSVASQVAIALRNARMFAQAQQQAERQALINEISEKIRAADSIDDVLMVTATELGRALPVQRASVEIRIGEYGSNGTDAAG